MPRNLRLLSVSQIITWAESYHQATGAWPDMDSPGLAGSRWDSWREVDRALREGWRSLPGGSSLAKLLAEHLGVRNIGALPPLTEDQILIWADAYQRQQGRWPRKSDGTIPDTGGETWGNVDSALRGGLRGLPRGSSLARLLKNKREVRNVNALPPLTEKQILDWADAYHKRTGDWPIRSSGLIPDTGGETWLGVCTALSRGKRGLPRAFSLAQLLQERRAVTPGNVRPPLTLDLVLEWADAHRARTGKWPKAQSGAIPEAAGESWQAINMALKRGQRGLPKSGSLARVLAQERQARTKSTLRPYRIAQILGWADAYYRRTGAWPRADSGPVAEAPGETWLAVARALVSGNRGLPGGSSLAQLLAEERGKRNHLALPPLSFKKIIAWADTHHRRTGQWPRADSGPVYDQPGETWQAVDDALQEGRRGLRIRTTLLQLLARKRGVRHPLHLPPLTVAEILTWVDAYQRRHGCWPKALAGPIDDAPGETWCGVNAALREGKRGLPKSSLARLLDEHRRNQGGDAR